VERGRPLLFLKELLIKVAIELPFHIACGLFSGWVQWRLRTLGLWTVVSGFVLQIVLLLIGGLIAPNVVFPKTPGMSPVAMGISMGCVLPTVGMLLYHLRINPKDR
jgi:hypothetical protein